jgi:copper resistance protein C
MQIPSLLAASVLAATVIAASPAQAHAKLEASDPQAGSTLSHAPKEVRLKFNEALEQAFSKIKLTGPGSAEVALAPAKVDAADARTMSASLPALASGEYHVRWSTMTHDGHKTKGEFSFKVK